MGRDVAPRLAALLGACVCLDCIGLSIEEGTRNLLQTKPVFGGNAHAVWSSENLCQRVVTLRRGAAEPAERQTSRQGEVIPIRTAFDGSDIKVRLVDWVEEKVQGIKLEEARVIVAGGGGIGGREGFTRLEELARILNGTVGISRVPKDEGWMPGHLEIGQTGRVVRPDLYFAVGISGAPQHMAGCAGAKCIVAINKDPEAHIFQEADLGIVGDYRDVLPKLTEKFKELSRNR
jgi:electron transfer flavoprotein alpha subunit